MHNTLTWEAVVIGSGFGGAVACCRLAAKWPGQVLLLERGKHYPKGSFARAPQAFANNFWSGADSRAGQGQKGLYDIRNFRRMDAVVCAGLGGGSLIYANVFMTPPAWVFDAAWPAALQRATLEPYYAVAQSVLGARPLPDAGAEPRRVVRRSALFAEFAQSEGQSSQAATVCVFFGKDYGQGRGAPLAMGEQERNRYGASQTSCTYCGECDVGCNLHAKNTLDLNYLHVAQQQHGAELRTECEAVRIVPLDAQGQEDSSADGRYGYCVHYRDASGQAQQLRARRVVLSAGTLGSNELLLRCRDTYGSLPRISQQLGRRFSGNGDFVSLVAGARRQADPNYGPVITQYIDYGLRQPQPGQPAYLLEDAAYPAFAAWYVEGLRPALNPAYVLRKAWLLLRLLGRRLRQSLLSGKWSGSVAAYAQALLQGDLAYRSSVLLFMGRDAGDGVLSLQDGRLDLHWPQQSSRALYEAMLDCGRRFARFVGSGHYIPQPTWSWPLRNNITVHPLGGCALGESAATGVVACQVGQRGQVFGYQGLYVVDGAVLPGPVGANPSATIAALAEWIAEDITGIPPDDTLGVPAHA